MTLSAGLVLLSVDIYDKTAWFSIFLGNGFWMDGDGQIVQNEQFSREAAEDLDLLPNLYPRYKIRIVE